jgi:hypothetical protein
MTTQTVYSKPFWAKAGFIAGVVDYAVCRQMFRLSFDGWVLEAK